MLVYASLFPRGDSKHSLDQSILDRYRFRFHRQPLKNHWLPSSREKEVRRASGSSQVYKNHIAPTTLRKSTPAFIDMATTPSVVGALVEGPSVGMDVGD